jgi:chromosome segregation ATPase
MPPVNEQLARVGAKVSKLIRDLDASEKENGRLRQEIESLRRRQDELTESCRMMEEQAGVLKAAAGRLDENTKKELEKRLSQYIREIDRCIALLGH